MREQTHIIDHFDERDIELLPLDKVEEFERQWRTCFCNYAKADKADIHLEQFKWHTFSFKKFPSLEGKDAEAAYVQQKARSYVVLPERSVHENEAAFIATNLPSIDLPCLPTDFYVFPKNMAWTMAFTHEQDWIGPFFAKHRDYTKLNRKNIQAYEALEKSW